MGAGWESSLSLAGNVGVLCVRTGGGEGWGTDFILKHVGDLLFIFYIGALGSVSVLSVFAVRHGFFGKSVVSRGNGWSRGEGGGG